MRTLAGLSRLVVALALVLFSAVTVRHAMAMPGDVQLPAPSISRALDAVLLPIDDHVAYAFGLASDERGLLVLAVQPGGVADIYGIEPGDILYDLGGSLILSPRDLDVLVWRGLNRGNQDFGFNFYRGGSSYVIDALITFEYWEETFSFEEISTWESWSYEEFSYSEYIEEYSEQIEISYYEEETLIEEEVLEEDAADAGIVDESFDEEATFESDGDEFVDEDMEDEAVDACVDSVATDECFEEDVYDDDEDLEDGGDEFFEEDAGDDDGDEFFEEDAGDDDGGDVIEE